jgi:hypothetical protein
MATEAQTPDPFGALCWRNWKLHEAGAAPDFEAVFYSDASFSGGPEYSGIGSPDAHTVPADALRQALVSLGSRQVDARGLQIKGMRIADSRR